jgi:epoxyqueuosine reductase
MTSKSLKEQIKMKALELGFHLFGVAAPEYHPADHDRLLSWLEKDYHSDMAYLAKAPRRRFDPKLFLKDVKSIIVVAANYYKNPGYDKTKPYISIYARGKPYQKVIRDRLKQLLEYIRELHPEAKGKIAVDTSPTSDKLWGQIAGIGWRGKNTILINKKIGSFIFLGELFLNLELPPDRPETDHCADCRKCLDSCPTGALESPHLLNTARCISYLTIEAKSPIEQPSQIGNHVLGCDICQLVCPYNQSPPTAGMAELQSSIDDNYADWFTHEMTEVEFKNRFEGTILAEYGFNRVINNMAIVHRNLLYDKNGSLFA